MHKWFNKKLSNCTWDDICNYELGIIYNNDDMFPPAIPETHEINERGIPINKPIHHHLSILPYDSADSYHVKFDYSLMIHPFKVYFWQSIFTEFIRSYIKNKFVDNVVEVSRNSDCGQFLYTDDFKYMFETEFPDIKFNGDMLFEFIRYPSSDKLEEQEEIVNENNDSFPGKPNSVKAVGFIYYIANHFLTQEHIIKMQPGDFTKRESIECTMEFHNKYEKPASEYFQMLYPDVPFGYTLLNLTDGGYLKYFESTDDKNFVEIPHTRFYNRYPHFNLLMAYKIDSNSWNTFSNHRVADTLAIRGYFYKDKDES